MAGNLADHVWGCGQPLRRADDTLRAVEVNNLGTAKNPPWCYLGALLAGTLLHNQGGGASFAFPYVSHVQITNDLPSRFACDIPQSHHPPAHFAFHVLFYVMLILINNIPFSPKETMASCTSSSTTLGF
jgi:hypothetical protein